MTRHTYTEGANRTFKDLLSLVVKGKDVKSGDDTTDRLVPTSHVKTTYLSFREVT